MKKLIIYTLFIIAGCNFLYAQKRSAKIARISDEYIIHLSSEIYTPSEAEKKAIEEAKIQALADKYGTVIMGNTSTSIISKEQGGNASSQISMTTYSASDVRGEWIEDIEKPKVSLEYRNEIKSYVIKVILKGKVREIKRATIDFVSSVLKNGLTSKFESNNFRDGDEIYLKFCSAINGYLAVYLISGNDVFCMLPYSSENKGSKPVKRGIEYTFFSNESYEFDTKHEIYTCIPDEYVLTCSGDQEENRLYILFSPDEFTKAVGKVGQDGLEHISFDNFQEWLIRNKGFNSQIQEQRIGLTIRK